MGCNHVMQKQRNCREARGMLLLPIYKPTDPLSRLGTIWGQPGVNLGSTWGRTGVHLRSPWCQNRSRPGVKSGFNMGTAWGQLGISLGSAWGQHGVNVGSTSRRAPPRRLLGGLVHSIPSSPFHSISFHSIPAFCIALHWVALRCMC